MTQHMTATDARKNFFSVLETAQKPGMTVSISHEGRPNVIMMSQEEFEGWQETLEILSDTELMKDLREAMQETDTITLEELVELEHSKSDVQTGNQTQGAKAVRRTASKRPRKSPRRIQRTA